MTIESALVSGAARVGLVLAVGLAAYAVLARSAASTRRLVLALTLGAAVVVPIIAAIGPRWTVETPAAIAFAHESDDESATGAIEPPAELANHAHVSAATTTSNSVDVTRVLALAWLAIALALLARAIASQLRVRGIVRRASPVARTVWADARVAVRASSEVDSPVVTGLFRPTIVIPHAALDWPLERCRLVLVHEMAHVRRRDVLVRAIADAACAIHWCNPLAWIAARRLRVECEIAADDAVLAAGVRPSHYAEELVAVATSIDGGPRAALAMADHASLETRVTSILAGQVTRVSLTRRGTITVATIGTIFAIAAACTSPTEAAPASGTGTDAAIQRIADDEIAALDKDWSPERGVIIVLDAATGEILANAGRTAGKSADLSSTAVAPGSTLKPIAIAAALETHTITVDQKFDCTSPRAYGDKAIHDFSPSSGKLDLGRILAVSSNVGASRIFDALGGDNLATWLRAFHISGVPAKIPSGYEGVAIAIGEGLTATPRDMIGAYGAFASDGMYHPPTFDRGGSKAERLLTTTTARDVMTLLTTAVADEHATSKAARVDGIRIAGKTGTAVWTEAKRSHTYASFIGIADIGSRRLVILVGVDTTRSGVSGGKVAAPVFARIVKRLAPAK